ncbi:MAG: peptide deformylase [Bacteroidia bacterium]|nr:MAG: peptide deformylase [Bacteroidia bacterium]PIE86507.1 MAG: peptide deformylase [Bacteroidia bacterium]
MILPVVTYGVPVLRKVAKEVEKDMPNLKELIDNMFETMYRSDGVGLACPQVNKSLRMFVIDADPMSEEDESLIGFKKVFINPKITEFSKETWLFNEGCLSVPGIREDVRRPEKIRIEYYDENFEFHDEEFDGIKARVVQHEYDHLEGKLFTDKVSPIKKRILKGRLNSIMKGKFSTTYKTLSLA